MQYNKDSADPVLCCKPLSKQILPFSYEDAAYKFLMPACIVNPYGKPATREHKLVLNSAGPKPGYGEGCVRKGIRCKTLSQIIMRITKTISLPDRLRPG